MAERNPIAGDDLSRELTVCICTRDRTADLVDAVRSVLENASGARVVVSEDGSAPEPAALAGSHLCLWQKGPGRGLGANRNAAVRSAETRWVLFLDDDARVGSGFVDALENCLRNIPAMDRERAIVTGRERNRGTIVAPNDTDFLGFQRREYSPGDTRRTVVINAALWPRALFDRVGFDEHLRYGSDEVDISYSALAAGFAIWDCPEAVNLHNPSPRGRSSYQLDAHASRLRATTKRYWRLQRKRATALAYVVIGPAHLCASLVKQDGARGLIEYAKVMRRWLLPG